MKTPYVFVLILMMSLLYSCNRCHDKTSAMVTDIFGFNFSIVDKEGKDLFFGKDSIYNPYNVKVAYVPEGVAIDESEFKQISIKEIDSCFYIQLSKLDYVLIYLKLFSENIDTIKTIVKSTHVYDNKECFTFSKYKYDVFF